MKMKWKALLVASLLTAGSVWSVGGRADDAKLGGYGQEIVVLMPSRSNAYLAQWIHGAEKSAAEDNFKLTVVENNFDQTEQEAQAQQRISSPKQPAAYIWWPADNQAELATLRGLSRGAPITARTRFSGLTETASCSKSTGCPRRTAPLTPSQA